LFIRLKRDVSTIFPNIRLAGEMFRGKIKKSPRIMPPFAVKCRNRILIVSSVPLLQSMPGKSFSIHGSVRKWLALPL
jgi:hypothetical protein